MASTHLGRRLRRLPAWLVLTVAGAGLIVSGNVLDARAADEPPPPVVLSGSGDFDITAELVNWQNTLFAADQPTDFEFFQRGSKDGRGQLLAGDTQFTVGGVPFTAEELASRPVGAGEIIGVPLTVASLSIALTTSTKGGWKTVDIDRTCLADPPDGDTEACYTRGVYTGPIRIPPENLTALIVGLPPTYQNNRLAYWNSPGIVAALGISDLEIQGLARSHSFMNRSEGASASKYLMTYGQALGPTAWAMRKAENSDFPWEPIGEQFSTRTASRYGPETQIGVIALYRTDAISQGAPDKWVGNMGAVPTTYVGRMIADYPDAGFRIAEIQNKHGDWVSPTKETIDAALAAGTEPDYAALNDVPGAYPLVFVNHLYTVAGTLTPDQANALAASVRYIATDGQDQVVADGGTTLTPALQAEALAKADQIVTANCSADGYEVTTSGPGPFEPDTPQVQAMPSMLHCTPITEVAPTTTTTVAETTTVPATTTTLPETTTTMPATDPPITVGTPVATSPAYVPPVTVRAPTPIVTTAPLTASTEATDTTPLADESTTTTAEAVESEAPAPESTSLPVTETTRPRARGVPLTALPLDSPSPGSGQKQLGTVMLGSALFLGPRRFLQSRRARR